MIYWNEYHGHNINKKNDDTIYTFDIEDDNIVVYCKGRLTLHPIDNAFNILTPTRKISFTLEAINYWKKLKDKFPNASIVLTLGSQGSLFVNDNLFLRQSAVSVQPVDTTAAGDTYTGFFLSGIFSGRDAGWAMKYASVAAAIAVTRPGAAPSIPSREEVLSKMEG